MTRETNLATRGPLVEGLVTPRQVSPDPTLGEVARSGLPALGGYLVTTPKDLADVLSRQLTIVGPTSRACVSAV